MSQGKPLLLCPAPIRCPATALTSIDLQPSSPRHADHPGRVFRGLLIAVMMFMFENPGLSAGAALEFRSMQAKLEADLINATMPALKQLIIELLELEKKAATARDYDTAILVRNERQKLESQLASQEKIALLLAARQKSSTGDAQQERIVLNAADARLEKVRYDSAAAVLTDWAAPGASATWTLPNLPPGGYEVVLHYSSGPLEGGTVLVQEAFYSVSSDLRTTLKGLGEQNLGTLRIRDGAGTLKVSAKTVLKSNLMQLQSVELIPSNR